MEFSEDRPIYLQIKEWVIKEIIAGNLAPGAQIQPVREMAVQLLTNPNTVQRALRELEAEGVLFSKRGLGRFVTEDEASLNALNQTEVGKVVENFMIEMQAFGYDKSGILKIVKEKLGEETC